MNDIPLESVVIHRALTRTNLVLGADRELVMFSGLIAGTLVFYSWDVQAAVVGVLFWIFALFALRLMAKHDPKLRQAYMRHRIYKAHYPPQSSPWRNNTDSQGRQYRDPWKVM